jgi:hypothetical protein
LFGFRTGSVAAFYGRTMIDEPGHPGRHPPGSLNDKELSMLKTISAALLAASFLAAPAMAASTKQTTQAPVTKPATVDKSAQVKNPLNANAKMTRHHTRHAKHYAHHRTHKKMAAKVHKSLKVSAKPAKHPAKRG